MPAISEPKFSFDEVQFMIEQLLAQQTRAAPASNAALKRVNFGEIAAPGHSAESCKKLITTLVQSTRRIRTLSEVLTDIKENLKKNKYTNIIQRGTLSKEDLPKRPVSAYLLYHADRYEQLREENSLASEVSKRVSEEWRHLSDKKKREYQRRYENLLKQYEAKMDKLGLRDDVAPKRPQSAKALFIQDCLSGIDTSKWSREKMTQKKEELSGKFEALDPYEKDKWIALHQRNLEEYQRKRQEYIESHPHLDHKILARKKRTSTKLAPPEKPKSALKFYLQKKMPEDLEGSAHDEYKKQLKARFAQLKDKKLLKYVKKAVEDLERYKQEVAKFSVQHPEFEIPRHKSTLPKEQLKLYSTAVEHQPTPPAPNAYLHYCSKMLNGIASDGPTKRLQVASEAWRKLSDRERRNIERFHMVDVERYINEMDNWLMNQSEERKRQLMSEPKLSPDFWRKKLIKFRKREMRELKKEQLS